MFDSTKSKLGIGQRGKIYHGGEWKHPEEVSDPTAFEDEQHESLLDRLGDNWQLVAVLAILGLAGAIWLFYVSRNLAVSIVQHTAFQVLLAGIGIFALGHHIGYSRVRSLFYDTNWLVLASTSHLGLYVGEHKPGGEDDAPLFQIQRGFTLYGFDSNALTIGDVDPELARMHQRANKDPSDPATVRLHPGFVNLSDTFFGTVVFQLSDGLQLDPASRRSELHATVPKTADEDALEEVRQELETQRDRANYYEKRLSEVEEDRRELLESVSERREETLREFAQNLDQVSEGVAKMRGHGAGADGPSTNGDGPDASKPSDDLPELDSKYD